MLSPAIDAIKVKAPDYPFSFIEGALLGNIEKSENSSRIHQQKKDLNAIQILLVHLKNNVLLLHSIKLKLVYM